MCRNLRSGAPCGLCGQRFLALPGTAGPLDQCHVARERASQQSDQCGILLRASLGTVPQGALEHVDHVGRVDGRGRGRGRGGEPLGDLCDQRGVNLGEDGAGLHVDFGCERRDVRGNGAHRGQRLLADVRPVGADDVERVDHVQAADRRLSGEGGGDRLGLLGGAVDNDGDAGYALDLADQTGGDAGQLLGDLCRGKVESHGPGGAGVAEGDDDDGIARLVA